MKIASQIKIWFLSKWNFFLILLGLRVPFELYLLRQIRITYDNQVAENLFMQAILDELEFQKNISFLSKVPLELTHQLIRQQLLLEKEFNEEQRYSNQKV